MTEIDPLTEVEKVFGSPIATEYSDNALKVRRNLLLSSLISIKVCPSQRRSSAMQITAIVDQAYWPEWVP